MVASNYPPAIGGPAASVPRLSEYLAELGFDVHVVTQGYPGLPTVSRENGYTVYRCEPIKGSFYSFSAVSKKVLLMTKLGLKIARQNNIDIIHAHDPNVSGLCGMLLTKFH